MQKQTGFFVAMLAFSGAMLAQTPAPPVKMGLWQTTTTSTISGIQIPPDVAARLRAMGRPIPGAEPHVTVVQSCFTPEGWHEFFDHIEQNQDCQLTKRQESSAGMSADVACKSSDGSNNSQGHLQVAFESKEKMNGKAHMELTLNSQPRPMVADLHFESVYQGADCKDVSPGNAKVIH